MNTVSATPPVSSKEGKDAAMRSMSFYRAILAAGFGLQGGLSLGCTQNQPTRSYRTTPRITVRNVESAREANERGLIFAKQNQLELAERSFLEALHCDVSFASAHNNLGLVLLKRGRYYEAATEFSFASRLAPRSSEPRMNLGRLYEAIGWYNEAVAEYRKAVEFDGNNLEAVGRLASVSLRAGKSPTDIDPLLQKLMARDDGQWSRWAQSQMKLQGVVQPATE